MFINERFPPDISFDAKERVRHSTSVVSVNSGATSRNKNWAFPLREFDVSHAARIPSLIAQLVAFDAAVAEGQANSFRFKAWNDYTVTAGQGVITMLTSTTGQLGKVYGYNSVSKTRTIVLPIAATIVWTGSGSYTIDETTGIVTAVSGALPSAWTGQFDVRCYMGLDISEVTIKDKGGSSSLIAGIDQITLLEER